MGTTTKALADIGTICVPGSRLSVADKEHISGVGTYELQGYIFATLAGLVKTKQPENTNFKIISVESPRTPGIIPQPGNIVTTRVTVVNSRQVQCTILCVGPSVLVRPFRAVIKKEDIRTIEKDKVNPYKCYRPGDIILARVLPMTEIHWYHLTTAENDLGVVIATADGAQGESMLPLSWSEMQCPKTLVKEPRKVARVLPEKLDVAMFPVNSKRAS